MPTYTPSELYNLYKMYINNRWSHMCRFFFNTRKEPASVATSFEKVKTIACRYEHFLRTPLNIAENSKSVTYANMVRLMYSVPYEDLPTYINYEGYNIIAEWRLKLGR